MLNFSFLKLKKVWIPLVVIFLGIGIFFGLHQYQKNQCCSDPKWKPKYTDPNILYEPPICCFE